MCSTSLEIKIHSNLQNVKNMLKSISIYYQDDFLLEDIVFVTIGNQADLDSIRDYIDITTEQYAFQ